MDLLTPPAVFDTRLTIHNDRPMMNYAAGLFTTWHFRGEKLEIDRGRLPVYMEPEFREGYSILLDATGSIMYKFPTPLEITREYLTYEFWSLVKYTFEIRVHEIPRG